MPQLTAPVISSVILLAMLLYACPVQAATTFVRALGKVPSRAVVRYVAQNAQPLDIPMDGGGGASSDPTEDISTVRKIIVSLCGSVQPGYVDEIARLNSVDHIDLDAQITDAVRGYQWPACLYAGQKNKNEVSYTVAPNDTLTNIRQRFTGDGRYVPGRIDDFFKSSGLSTKNAKDLKPGREVIVPFVTKATTLDLKVSEEEFNRGLVQIGAASIAFTPGSIVDAVQFAPAETPVGATQGTFAPCEPGDGSHAYPYDPKEIADALKWTKHHLQRAVSPVSMVVVDNGFFGVPCDDAEHCPAWVGNQIKDGSPRFPAAFFDRDQFPNQYGFGPDGLVDVYPLNFLNRSPSGALYRSNDINEERGHGTHVAGLAIGGPLLLPFRKQILYVDDTPWMTLVIVAISGGNRQLTLGSDLQLADMLSRVAGTKIVNMSVTFDAKADPKIGAHIQDMVQQQRDSTLFVAAAGNEGYKNIEAAGLDKYPVRAGGLRTPNVITIASVDGPIRDKPQRLSLFTNASAQYVDLAAPGCKIASWLDVDHPEAAISGTSQAAPLVSFAAMLLRSMWTTAKPVNIKNRLLYSGDLLDTDDDQSVIASKAQLDIPKSLTFLSDRVKFRRDGVSHEILGTVDRGLIQGLRCDGGSDIDPRTVRAVKRAGSSEKIAIYTVDAQNTLQVCWGTQKPDILMHLDAAVEIVDGAIGAPSFPMADVAASELVEIVRAK